MELIDTAELAQRLGRSPETVVRWRRMRIGPPYLRVHNRVRYDWHAVQTEWLAPRVIHVAERKPAKRSRIVQAHAEA